MNEGTLSLLIQWCLLCLLWMGSFDRPLLEMGTSRSVALSAMGLVLVCSFVNWSLYFLPVQVSISGWLLPVLYAGWLYGRLAGRRRRLVLIAAVVTGFLLFCLRLLFFYDPVLLVMDETVMIPLTALCALLALSRDATQQLFLLFVAFPLSDTLFSLRFLPEMERCEFGGEYARDLLWSTVSLWCLQRAALELVKKGMAWLQTEKSKTNTRR
jgi:hypothetical protein